MNSTNSPRRLWVALLVGLFVSLPAAARIAWPDEHVLGNGQLQTQQRQAGPFTGLDLQLPAELELRQGTQEQVSVETDENLLPYVQTVVEKNTLLIRAAPGKSLQFRTLKIVVQARQIERIRLNGSGAIAASDLRSPQLAVSIRGSGNIVIKGIEAQTLSTSIDGSGDITLAGAAERLSASVRGSGKLGAGRLKASQVSASLQGSGDATVWAVQDLTVDIGGSADLKYWGDPRAKLSVAGSGGVRRLGPMPK